MYPLDGVKKRDSKTRTWECLDSTLKPTAVKVGFPAMVQSEVECWQQGGCVHQGTVSDDLNFISVDFKASFQ